MTPCRILHTPSMVVSESRLIVAVSGPDDLGVFFKVASLQSNVVAIVADLQQAPLFINIQSDSSPLVEGEEAIGFTSYASELSCKRACLTDVDEVTVFWLGDTRRTSPLPNRTSVFHLTGSVR